MKYMKLLPFLLFLFNSVYAQDFVIIEQDYQKAINTALQENKLLFIDFYTTWCAPCKKLDKLVFQSKNAQQVLGKDFVLLRYNAENDTVFNLSKKHHIFIYPSAVILDKNGYVLNRNYGFPGEDSLSLTESVLEFTKQSIENNRQNKFLKGYSNKIDISIYPKFYIDYINRTNTKVDPLVIKKYFTENKNIFSEAFFSTLLYFASYDIPEYIADSVLNNKKPFIDLYGEKEVEALLSMFSNGRFDKAITDKNQQKFEEAVVFMVKTLNKDYAEVIHFYKKEFLKATNNWIEVLKINEELKKKNEFSDGSINNFCWEVYKKCNDKKVIATCVQWMKELTNRKPEYSYLDTYAFILYKSGNKSETKRIVKLAIEAAKKEKESPKNMEKLLEKL